MLKVYIASPYTLGDVAVNVKRQMDVAHELMNLGCAPFVPLLTHFLHMNAPRPYEDWVAMDAEWVKACDVLLRLPGESKGADSEVELAHQCGMPIYHGVDEIAAILK